eukprot:CAMPEP_0180622384 /NCGR_PEP_ID=MMETSP1037_2-20121125/35654_1 /TAXON_ID=632150 /ORGANISM="Azadinium spinosum, Strain 3D9" /LENGTH=148 /DNA_ID=CAMNT_0022642625 /DNA_START=594 /DNA_END=1040 /DNA_ORIENTATION=-
MAPHDVAEPPVRPLAACRTPELETHALETRSDHRHQARVTGQRYLVVVSAPPRQGLLDSHVVAQQAHGPASSAAADAGEHGVDAGDETLEGAHHPRDVDVLALLAIDAADRVMEMAIALCLCLCSSSIGPAPVCRDGWGPSATTGPPG